MDIKPSLDRLIAGVKKAIVEIIRFAVGFIGFFIGDVVASHWHTRHGAYWFMTVFVVWFAYLIVIWLLQRAWLRYRRSSN
jgi:uncharacterized membrane protein YeaQ/YmgE (transglycosylase-associated protein family)